MTWAENYLRSGKRAIRYFILSCKNDVAQSLSLIFCVWHWAEFNSTFLSTFHCDDEHQNARCSLSCLYSDSNTIDIPSLDVTSTKTRRWFFGSTLWPSHLCSSPRVWQSSSYLDSKTTLPSRHLLPRVFPNRKSDSECQCGAGKDQQEILRGLARRLGLHGAIEFHLQAR